MNAKQLHEEIKATNLAYMGLVQKMIRADKSGTAASLGVSEEIAELVAGLSGAQLQKMSATNMMLCCFNFDESVMFNMISDHGKSISLARANAANQPCEALAA